MSFKKALSLIFLSILIVSGGTLTLFWYWKDVQKKRGDNPQFNIVALAQSTSHGEPLKLAYLAELLDLSTDRPQNLYKFESRRALKKLLESSLIKKGTLTKIKPGTLLIEYEVRQPIAFLGDFSNTAMDEEGFLIPFKPFFTPKKLPYLILGEEEEEWGKWGKPLQTHRAKLGLSVLKTVQEALKGESLQLIQLDVSRANSLSFGRREIIALIEEKKEQENQLSITPIYLRMSPQNYPQEIANFLAMRPQLVKDKADIGEKGILRNIPLLIELRVPQQAFVVSFSQFK